jgi:hypothetical protein
MKIREGFTYKQCLAINKALKVFDKMDIGYIENVIISFPSKEANGYYEIIANDEQAFDRLCAIIDLAVELCLDHGV